MKMFLLFIILAFLYLIASASATTITPFSSPENSFQVLSSYINGLKNSIYLSAYTFRSAEFAQTLINAARNGASVIIVIEDRPAGEPMNRDILCTMSKNKVDVYLYAGKLKFIHAKYIIGDNVSVSIGSGNFDPDSFLKNREWGALIEDEKVAHDLLKVYLKDLADSKKFECAGKSTDVETPQKSIELKKYISQKADLVVAPDATDNILDFLKTANSSIYVEQFYIYKKWGTKNNSFLEAVIDKARKGISVKILMDTNYYNTQKDDPNSNYNTFQYLKNVSASEKIPIEVAFANLSALGMTKIHNKGVIIDNKSVLVSSINWNENSPKNNREVGVIINGNSAEYFVDRFFSDWGSVEQHVEESADVVKKDYGKILSNVIIFITGMGIFMLIIKKKFYGKRRKIRYI